MTAFLQQPLDEMSPATLTQLRVAFAGLEGYELTDRHLGVIETRLSEIADATQQAAADARVAEELAQRAGETPVAVDQQAQDYAAAVTAFLQQPLDEMSLAALTQLRVAFAGLAGYKLTDRHLLTMVPLHT